MARIFFRSRSNQLLELEGIKEVAAIGLPNERLGEVAVVVHLRRTSLGMEQVVDYAKNKLAACKVPTQVFFGEPLPRNASNKILKAELKAKYVHPKGSS